MCIIKQVKFKHVKKFFMFIQTCLASFAIIRDNMSTVGKQISWKKPSVNLT